MSPVSDHENGSTPTPIERGFFGWTQIERDLRGLPPDPLPRKPKKLDEFRKRLTSFEAEVQAEPNGEARAKIAYGVYLEVKYWGRDRKPPWPFAGFLAQWRDYLPAPRPRPPPRAPPTELELELGRRLEPIRAAGHGFAAIDLAELRPVAIAGGRLQLRPTDRFRHAWIEDHYAKMLHENGLELLPPAEASP